MAKLTEEQSQRCPFCESYDLNFYDSAKPDGLTFIEYVNCEECNRYFSLIFKLNKIKKGEVNG